MSFTFFGKFYSSDCCVSWDDYFLQGVERIEF